MKKLILISTLFLFSAFITTEYIVKYSTSEVQQKDEFYIYHFSAPVKEHEILGRYKINGMLDPTPEKMLNKLIKNARETYPTGEGIIISPNMWYCDIIKFKK